MANTLLSTEPRSGSPTVIFKKTIIDHSIRFHFFSYSIPFYSCLLWLLLRCCSYCQGYFYAFGRKVRRLGG
jgi:hypothetical protein